MRPDTILEKRGVMTRFLGVPRFLWLCGLATTLPLQGCIHDLLSVTDPDIITDDQLNANTAAGAVALNRSWMHPCSGNVVARPQSHRNRGTPRNRVMTPRFSRIVSGRDRKSVV